MAPADSDSGVKSWVLHAMVATDVAYADIIVLRNRIALLSAAVLLGALALGAFAARRLIVQPIRAVTMAMNNVARGNTEIDLPGQERRDEIGEMLRSISVFRSNLLTQNELIREREQAALTQNLRFDAALSNMSQGLAMFDAEGRLVVGNRRFFAMYRIPPQVVENGATEKELVEHGRSIGLYDTASALFYRERDTGDDAHHDVLELSDGRIFEISHQPMAGGGWVSTHEDVTERRQAEVQISHMARHDTLTNLPNRVLFRHDSREVLKRAERGESVAILCLDLDYFKQVNDTLGHPVGDLLLCAVADRLRSTLRETDTVARLGGDEFAIIQCGVEQ